MGDIKSALEIALEKTEGIGEATREERLKWKHFPEGELIAAKYLKQDADLTAQIAKYDQSVVKYFIEGASSVLIKNINLPRDELTKRTNKRAMDGLKNIKNDKLAVENVFNKIRRIFTHYLEQGEQQRKQAYNSLKVEIEAKLKQALQQQMGSNASGLKINVEKQPQFQEEWRRMQVQLDAQYLQILGEYKNELAAID